MTCAQTRTVVDLFFAEELQRMCGAAVAADWLLLQRLPRSGPDGASARSSGSFGSVSLLPSERAHARCLAERVQARFVSTQALPQASGCAAAEEQRSDIAEDSKSNESNFCGSLDSTRCPGSGWKTTSLTADERGIFTCDHKIVWLGSACSSDHSMCSDGEEGSSDRSGLLFTDAAHLVL
jgi:hypothetical protein